MKKNKYVLIGFLVVSAIFLFEYKFLEPRSETLRESIESQYDTLQKYEYFVKDSGTTEENVEAAIDDMKEMEERLIQEKSESLASPKLQSELSVITGKAGLNVLNVKPLAPVKTGKYSSIPIYFEGNGNIKQIGDFLKYVESGDIMIKIDKLSLNITNLQNPRDLKFKIQVSGLMKT